MCHRYEKRNLTLMCLEETETYLISLLEESLIIIVGFGMERQKSDGLHSVDSESPYLKLR